jgi:hypothetical protein
MPIRKCQRSFFVALLIAGPLPSMVRSQTADSSRSKTAAGRWLTLANVDILQSFDKKLASLPASFSYTHPAGSRSSTAVNAAARYNVVANPRFAGGPTLEAAINSALKKPQHQIKGGVTGDVYVFSLSRCSSHGWTPYVSFGIERAHDGEKKTDGWTNQVQTSLVSKVTNNPLWYLSNQEFGPHDVLSIVLTPYIGIEHQTADSATVSRSALRGKASYSVNVKPLPTLLRERLTLAATDEIRKDWIRSGYSGDGWARWFIASVDYVLLSAQVGSEKHAASIGVTYKKGANPAEAFQRQELTEVAFKIQF